MRARFTIRVFLCGLSIAMVVFLSVILVWVLYGFAGDGDPLREAGFYSLVISVLTLEATITIALVVFGLQGRREAERRKLCSHLAAEIVFADIEIAF